ncbi:hypothetical protein NC652_040454 [Populus alba x Populus x berolinensis]|nr:hypothetical protein NC652_040454 [Populus alba x Populus x berolinensis]
MKIESGTGAEKEGLHNEKESVDGSVRISEQENQALEPKKRKYFDNWKNVDKEAKDKKKEREAGIEGDRPEKGSMMCGKDSDDGCADVLVQQLFIQLIYHCKQMKIEAKASQTVQDVSDEPVKQSCA